MEEKEIWKDIEGYEDYQISSYGRVKNKRGIITFGNKGDKDGYLRITLTKNNIQKTYKIHRLVAKAFIPNPDNKPCVDHISTVKDDNRVENLRWCTSKENNNNPITKIKMGKAKKGFKHTEECKKRMSEIQKQIWLNYTTEEKEKLSQKLSDISTAKKNVYIYKPDGELVAKHKGITVAAESVNGLRQSVGNACYHRLGRKKTNVYKGYIWSFNNELQ